MYIDAHTHIGRLGGRDCAAAALTQYLNRLSIGCALVSNLDAASAPAPAMDADETDANVGCLAACATDPRLTPLYWVRPGRVDSHVTAFAGALQSEPFGGAVFSPAANAFAADAELLDPYVAVLERFNLPAAFQADRDDRAAPVRVYNLARRHPSVAFVLYDAGADTYLREALDVARRAHERGDARLYLDTAHASTEEVLAMIQAAGAERVLFGSDAPHADPREAATSAAASARDPAALMPEVRQKSRATLERLRQKLTPRDFTAVAGGNAAGLFRIRREGAESNSAGRAGIGLAHAGAGAGQR